MLIGFVCIACLVLYETTEEDCLSIVLKDVTRTGNRDLEKENEEWGMRNGERRMGNEECGMWNVEWGMGNGEWGMGNGK